MIIGKTHTHNRFSFTVRIFSGIYVLCHERDHIHEHVHRGNSAVLGSQFACSNLNLACVLLTNMRLSANCHAHV